MSSYGAFVTVRYWCPNMCSDTDADETNSLDDIVRMVVESEGVMGVCDDAGTITNIELVKQDE